MDSDMTFDPSRIKALTFDVGGSVFDWQTPVIAHVGQLAAHHSVELDAHEFAHRWRRRFFAVIAEIRAGKRTKMNADEIHRHLLDGVCEHYALPATDADKDELTWVWHAMGVWSDVPEALERLRTRYKVTILSVLSLSILVDSSKHAGISWDGMMSCEFLTHYKPEPESYRQGAALLACDVEHTHDIKVAIPRRAIIGRKHDHRVATHGVRRVAVEQMQHSVCMFRIIPISINDPKHLRLSFVSCREGGAKRYRSRDAIHI